MNPLLSRRHFLQAAAVAPFANLLPQHSSMHWLPRGQDRCLLVLELLGGNDGLNTVIPLDDALYAAARPRLSVVRRAAHPIAAGFGLHESLAWLAGRMAVDAAVVHGVGYAQPDRSHFRSRDIWHSGDPALLRVAADTTGWLGRAADLLAAQGAGMPAASVGSLQVPLLLKSRQVVVPTLERVEDFALQLPGGGGDASAVAAIAAADAASAGGDAADLRGFLAATAADAVATAARLQAALQRYRAASDYPDTALGRDLQLVARMAIAGFGTRLFHVGFGSFDTHAQQLPTQQGLLRQLDQALGALHQDLQAQGLLERTVVLLHSEFGRRTHENQSQGTDHGAAAPVLLLGGGVVAGLHGTAPDLSRLLDGDLPPTTDFRSVYGDLLGWLGIDAAAVLGGRFAPVGVLAGR